MRTSGPDIGDMGSLVFYYVPSFLICVLAIAVLWIVAHCWKRELTTFGTRTRILAMGLPLLIWIFYLVSTGHDAYAITLLDSENNLLAEDVYYGDFTVDLNHALALARDTSQSGNVRFYASCRLADLLAGTTRVNVDSVLQQVDDAPAFQTGFGGTNQLTCGYFVPNYAEGPFTVRGIIEKRMSMK